MILLINARWHYNRKITQSTFVLAELSNKLGEVLVLKAKSNYPEEGSYILRNFTGSEDFFWPISYETL